MTAIEIYGAHNKEKAMADKIVRDFLKFHKANPHVYEALKNMAYESKTRGHDLSGIGFLSEIYRWRGGPTVGDEFKLNNNFCACYSRLIMKNEPRLRGMFQLRKSVADSYFELFRADFDA